MRRSRELISLALSCQDVTARHVQHVDKRFSVDIDKDRVVRQDQFLNHRHVEGGGEYPISDSISGWFCPPDFRLV